MAHFIIGILSMFTFFLHAASQDHRLDGEQNNSVIFSPSDPNFEQKVFRQTFGNDTQKAEAKKACDPNSLLKPPAKVTTEPVVIKQNCCHCPEDGCCVCCNDCCCQSACCLPGGCCTKSNGDCCCDCGDPCCDGDCCYQFGQCCKKSWCGLFKCLGWCCINFPWEDCCECLGECLEGLDFDD